MSSATRFNHVKICKLTARKILRDILALVLAVALPANVAPAQELDSSTLQKEAAEAQQKQQQPASQASPSAMQPPAQSQQTVLPPGPSIMLPAGTKLPLGLLRPISVKHAKPGDSVYLQITFPVTAGSQMVIPPGTYVQGVIDKIIRRDKSRALLEFEMRSTSLIFSSGYTTSFSGSVDVVPTTAQQLRQPGPGNTQNIPIMSAVGTPAPLPPLPTPSLGNGPRNAMIGLGVAAAVGTTLLFVLGASHGSDVEMEAGTPLQIVLQVPLELDRERVLAAVQQYSVQVASAPPQIVQPPVKPRICYDPGSPGTPDTVIPGSPGTPPTVIPGMNGVPDTVIPGTPATPDTVIPGTPGTPGREYPCPK